MINKTILLASYNVTMNTWNKLTQRYSDSTIIRKGRCISFSGTEEEFEKLHDELLEDESNFKVIGVYQD
jgi:hypothetical protein